MQFLLGQPGDRVSACGSDSTNKMPSLSSGGYSMPTSHTAIVILGASGDLARRKLIPALSRLYEHKQIDDSCIIVGSGRTVFSDEEFRNRFEVSRDFAGQLHYHQGITGLKSYIKSKGIFDQVIFFLALPPKVYAATAGQLYDEGFGEETRLIIEKPFGYDYDSARGLNRHLQEYYNERQIYRIDHYLAKEAVQNILVFRFGNSIFYPVWNSNYIDSIQINAYESIGVEDRGAYFDGAGIIRDMVQNHLMQLICLLTMEAPVSLDPEEIRAQKINILKALRVTDCCRFQYNGYRDEAGVAPDSSTETYAELKLFIDTYRWNRMPVYLRTGKALHRKGTEIGMRFKKPPRLLFNKNGDINPNEIIFKIQPSAGIVVEMASKVPGSDVQIIDTSMKFCYIDSFKDEIPEAYQKLLLDAIKGDRTLFVSALETELSWKKFGPFLDAGNLNHHARGTAPEPCLYKEWINFDKYDSLCR
ncbi:MAG: glucose-6-phosphate dehydrogenase [Chitinivibrionales bacterium]|nr:glucose-6-phosphate dehydrogenase [Chitinivibrionales bacterium]